MNSTVEPRLEVIFAEKDTCESHEQCMEPTQENADAVCFAIQTHSNGVFLQTTKLN